MKPLYLLSFLFFLIFIVVTHFIPILYIAIPLAFTIWFYEDTKERKPRESKQGLHKLSFFLAKKQNYMKSQTWHTKRLKVLKRDGYRCTKCGSRQHLHVHHLAGYDKIPFEPITCLTTLCADCHKAFHDIWGYPHTYSEYMSWNHLELNV